MITFSEIGLQPEILRAIEEMGFVNPTPIQEKAIPVLLKGESDIVGLAQTGTGKTAAYGIPILERVDLTQRYPQALILSPTRELCLQISKDLGNFSKYLRGLKVVAVYGGASIMQQIRDLRSGANVVVATPGRLNDLIRRKEIDLSNIEIVVLDEADEMLNMGFQEEIDLILDETPAEKLTWLFSATMPSEVRRIASNYMKKPIEITMGKTKEGAENIRHLYYVVQARDRYPALKRILDFSPELFGIIFCRTKIETQDVAEKLIRDGYNADAIHGDLSQGQREKVMSRFRNRTLQCLVATDVAARGIDVSDITHVVHYNLPDDLENYTHRAGRTARAGKSGVSLSLINSKETYRIRTLEKALNRKFLREMVPNGQEVCEMKLFSMLKKVHDVEVNEELMAAFLPRIIESFSEMSKEDIVMRFATLEFSHMLEYYQKAPDLNVQSASPDRRKEHDGGERYISGQRIFLNLGKVDGMDRSAFIKFIVETSGVRPDAIGRIDVRSIHTYFEVDHAVADQLLHSFKGAKFRGRPLRIDKATPNQGMENEGGDGRKKPFKEHKRKDFSSDRKKRW